MFFGEFIRWPPPTSRWAIIMYFLDNDPSENRMEFTKLQVACKYTSIGKVCAYF